MRFEVGEGQEVDELLVIDVGDVGRWRRGFEKFGKNTKSSHAFTWKYNDGMGRD